jgi:hypothetical protein
VRTIHLSPLNTSRRIVVSSGRVLSDERHIRSDKGPLFVGNVAWVWFSSSHAKMLPGPS